MILGYTRAGGRLMKHRFVLQTRVRWEPTAPQILSIWIRFLPSLTELDLVHITAVMPQCVFSNQSPSAIPPLSCPPR